MHCIIKEKNLNTIILLLCSFYAYFYVVEIPDYMLIVWEERKPQMIFDIVKAKQTYKSPMQHYGYD